MKVKVLLEVLSSAKPKATVFLGSKLLSLQLFGVLHPSKAYPFVRLLGKSSSETEKVVPYRVEALLKALSQFDPETEVFLFGKRKHRPVLAVASYGIGEEEKVFLHGEGDFDISGYISNWAAVAIESGEDETEFYQCLLDFGFTLDILRRHMGDEFASHMEAYCKEHGLM